MSVSLCLLLGGWCLLCAVVRRSLFAVSCVSFVVWCALALFVVRCLVLGVCCLLLVVGCAMAVVW